MVLRMDDNVLLVVELMLCVLENKIINIEYIFRG